MHEKSGFHVQQTHRRRSRQAWLTLAWCAFALFAAACSRPSDETRIRAAIGQMESAMEAGKPADFMEHVAEDFTGADGSADRASLHNVLRGQVLANARIAVSLTSTEVQLHDDRATVTVTVALTGGNGRWLPERGGVYRIESGWRRESGQWRCVNAQWERTL